MRIVGWTPLKHKSTRFPGKNWHPLAGKPLFCHMVETLLGCDLVDDVYINTDSECITKRAYQEFGNRVRVIERKPEHLDPALSTVEMLADDLAVMDADLVAFCHCTVPLLKPETLATGIRAYMNNAPRYDSVVSVTRLHERFYDHLGRAVNFHPGVILPLQELPPVYLENNAFFILAPDTIETLHNRVGLRPLMFEIEPDEAVDIDHARDLRYAEFLLNDAA